MAGLSYYYDQIRRGFSTVLNGLSTRLYGRGGEVEAAEEAPQPAPEWGYDEHNGPATWAQTFPAARGLSQSPIDLRYETTSYDGKLTEKMVEWSYEPEDSSFARNDGHILVISVNGDRSSLKGGPLKNKYKIENFHFHWGSDNSCGSEHLLEGKAFPAEVHVVHYNTEYGSFANAVDKPNGLCVLGSFIDIGPPHEGMTPLFNELLAHCKYKFNEFDLSAIGGADPATLLPDAASSPEFYSYAGSLTTPPCFESVLWINFLEPITFSQEQIDCLRQMSLSPDSDEPKLVNNFRPVCPLGNRTVVRSFKTSMSAATHKANSEELPQTMHN